MKLKNPLAAIREHEKRSHIEDCERRRNAAVNVMEYDGFLCLSVDGTPIFRIDDLGIGYDDIPDVLESGRKIWQSWQLRKIQ